MEEPDGFTVLSHVPIPKLAYDQPARTYTLVELNDPTTGQYQHMLVSYTTPCLQIRV